eukprot:5703183-Amphidinium_carterae.1
MLCKRHSLNVRITQVEDDTHTCLSSVVLALLQVSCRNGVSVVSALFEMPKRRTAEVFEDLFARCSVSCLESRKPSAIALPLKDHFSCWQRETIHKSRVGCCEGTDLTRSKLENHNGSSLCNPMASVTHTSGGLTLSLIPPKRTANLSNKSSNIILQVILADIRALAWFQPDSATAGW